MSSRADMMATQLETVAEYTTSPSSSRFEQEFADWLESFRSEDLLSSTSTSNGQDPLNMHDMAYLSREQHETTFPVSVWNPINNPGAATTWSFNDATMDVAANSTHDIVNAVNDKDMLDRLFHRASNLLNNTALDLDNLFLPLFQVDESSHGLSRESNGVNGAVPNTMDLTECSHTVDRLHSRDSNATPAPGFGGTMGNAPQSAAAQMPPIPYVVLECPPN